MKPKPELILDDCLAQMKQGKSLEESLQPYPEMVDEIETLLKTAQRIQQLPLPQLRSEAFAASQQAMFQALEKNDQAKQYPDRSLAVIQSRL